MDVWNSRPSERTLYRSGKPSIGGIFPSVSPRTVILNDIFHQSSRLKFYWRFGRGDLGFDIYFAFFYFLRSEFCNHCQPHWFFIDSSSIQVHRDGHNDSPVWSTEISLYDKALFVVDHFNFRAIEFPYPTDPTFLACIISFWISRHITITPFVNESQSIQKTLYRSRVFSTFVLTKLNDQKIKQQKKKTVHFQYISQTDRSYR